MLFLLPEEVPRERVRRSFGHRVLSATALSAMLAGGCVVAGSAAAPVLRELPRMLWLAAVPLLLVVAVTVLVVGAHVARAALCALRRGNWVMRVADDGVYLKLRSYLNAHFEDDEPTVVHLPFGELAGARRVTREPSGEEEGAGDRHRLELLTTADTSPLREAVARESRIPGPEISVLGIRTRGRSPHSPVSVPAPGVVHVEWLGRRMLHALEGSVAILEDRRAAPSDPRETAAALLELAQRGELVEATKLARAAYGMDLTGARALVESLRGERGDPGRSAA